MYNGYPNRATWNVSLWLNNDEPLYREKQNIVERAKNRDNLAENLKGFCNYIWPTGVTPDGDALAECDWSHLADNEWDDREETTTNTDSSGYDADGPIPRTENEQITLASFITKHNLKFACHRVDSRPDGLMDADYPKDGLAVTRAKDKMRHFRCRITRPAVRNGGDPGKTLSFGLYFSQGSAHTEDPTLADVLDCLASDASSYENARGFEDWASEFGYDADSRQAEKIFRSVKRQAEQLKRTIGTEAYSELLWNTERL